AAAGRGADNALLDNGGAVGPDDGCAGAIEERTLVGLIPLQSQVDITCAGSSTGYQPGAIDGSVSRAAGDKLIVDGDGEIIRAAGVGDLGGGICGGCGSYGEEHIAAGGADLGYLQPAQAGVTCAAAAVTGDDPAGCRGTIRSGTTNRIAAGVHGEQIAARDEHGCTAKRQGLADAGVGGEGLITAAADEERAMVGREYRLVPCGRIGYGAEDAVGTGHGSGAAADGQDGTAEDVESRRIGNTRGG